MHPLLAMLTRVMERARFSPCQSHLYTFPSDSSVTGFFGNQDRVGGNIISCFLVFAANERCWNSFMFPAVLAESNG